MAMGGVYTDALADMAKGKVKTVPAFVVTFAFLTENMGVIVTGLAPVIIVGDTFNLAFLPNVLRSNTSFFSLPANAVGATDGIFGETWGKAIVSRIGFLFRVLKSKTSVALAVAITPAMRTETTITVRIDFIHEPPFSKGYCNFNPIFVVREL
jgi:hypothetical protein